jgi:hypothetical protein
VGRTINDLSPSGGFVPISKFYSSFFTFLFVELIVLFTAPNPDGETEDIFSGMSSWTLDADEITFSDKIGEGSAAKGTLFSLSKEKILSHKYTLVQESGVFQVEQK